MSFEHQLKRVPRDGLIGNLKREASHFSISRTDDPSAALRLLAFDGILTEMLGGGKIDITQALKELTS